MKMVQLASPAVMEGAVRYPVEGPFVVTNEHAEHLKDSGVLDGEPEDLPLEEEPAETETKAQRARGSKEA